MSDRGVFLTAFLTLVLVVAGAFAIPEFFVDHLMTSAIFVVIAVMVFFGDDKFPYMLGMVAPVIWIIVAMLTGRFVMEFRVLLQFLTGGTLGRYDTPLHGFAFLSGLALLVLAARAWRKQVTEKFLGKTFAIATIVTVVWVAVIVVWQFRR